MQAIAERLADCEPKLVFTTDGYRRNGNVYDLRTKVDEALADITSVSTAVTHAHVGQEASASEVDERDWDSYVEGYDSPAETAVVDTDHPALIAYSSGTTGKPKGTIHTHVSLLTMGLKEGKYQFDLRERDTFLWITDYGWIVVPSWLVCGSIGTGGKTVLVGGAPTHPSGERLWDIVERRDVTTLGMSPTSARTLRQINDSPRENWDLSSLRILGLTGEPWDVETWNWVRNAVGNGHLPIVNDSGGTEVCGGLLSPTPLTSLEPGTLYGPAPGIPANVYDESGTPADEGYLVVEGSVPGMTRSLTGGDDRYLAEYWEDFEGVWNQNDWTYIDDGFWYIEGRDDDTMNVSGRRVTAPTIEGTILEHSAVDEAAVIGVVADDGGEQPGHLLRSSRTLLRSTMIPSIR